jgi:VanZ family protein
MKKKSYIAVFVTLAAAIVILHNSMYPIAQSDLQSGFVLHALNRFFSGKGHDLVLTQYIVRKLAHFTEYFFFGLLLTITLRTFHKMLQGVFFLELFLFLAVPMVDETIQIFYQGRTSNVVDVWIDFSGCIAGMGLCYLIHALFRLFVNHH